jgi:hypothetical protein
MFPRVFSGANGPAGTRHQAAGAGAERLPGRCLRPGRDCPRRPHPGRLVYQNAAYEKAVAGFVPPKGVYSHIVGIDIVRTGPEDFFVLEDNCRTPSGVSYMLESREIMMRMFPALFRENRIEPVDGYSERLRRTLASVAPAKCQCDPTRGDPDARPFQQRLLRTQLAGRPDGRRTGRGAGSVRRGRIRLCAPPKGRSGWT